VYGRISRGSELRSGGDSRGTSNVLKAFDFPDPMLSSEGREVTVNSQQQLFVLNSAFMHDQAAALAANLRNEDGNAAKIRGLYRKVLARDPSAKELDIGLSYLADGTVQQYAQVLLSTNEEIFLP
jgi:hypothetical protein